MGAVIVKCKGIIKVRSVPVRCPTTLFIDDRIIGGRHVFNGLRFYWWFINNLERLLYWFLYRGWVLILLFKFRRVNLLPGV